MDVVEVSDDELETGLAFDVSNWASLQREIKDNFAIVESGMILFILNELNNLFFSNNSEEKLRNEAGQTISNFSKQLLKSHLRVREATDRLKNKLRKVFLDFSKSLFNASS